MNNEQTFETFEAGDGHLSIRMQYTDSEKLDLIYKQNEMILERFDQILSIANDIKGEVSPLIARLESHPMAKMFLGGK